MAHKAFPAKTAHKAYRGSKALQAKLVSRGGKVTQATQALKEMTDKTALRPLLPVL
jgi:hypothetical protein